MKFIYKIALVFVFLFLYLGTTKAQDKKFNPFANGEPIGLVFANFHTGINQGDNPTAIEIRRAYLGYKFNMSKGFSTKIELDIGSQDDVLQSSLLRRFAYFKEVFLQYETGKFRMQFGIIPLAQFKVQEKVWGHRYIAKTVIDEHGMDTSADLGASVNYKATSFMDIDFLIMNGEGYSKPQNDNSYKAGIGITFRPWKGLIYRIYSDVIQKSDAQVMLVNFIGYEIKDKLFFGLEYDFKINVDYKTDQDIYAFSTFLSYDFNTKFQIFGRYDNVSTNIPTGEDEPWGLMEDGSGIIAGVQYRPISQVKLALNFQDWIPYAGNVENQAYIFLNVEFSVW